MVSVIRWLLVPPRANIELQYVLHARNRLWLNRKTTLSLACVAATHNNPEVAPTRETCSGKDPRIRRRKLITDDDVDCCYQSVCKCNAKQRNATHCGRVQTHQLSLNRLPLPLLGIRSEATSRLSECSRWLVFVIEFDCLAGWLTDCCCCVSKFVFGLVVSRALVERQAFGPRLPPERKKKTLNLLCDSSPPADRERLRNQTQQVNNNNISCYCCLQRSWLVDLEATPRNEISHE